MEAGGIDKFEDTFLKKFVNLVTLGLTKSQRQVNLSDPMYIIV